MIKISVYVPDSRIDLTDVRGKLDTLRWMAGGQSAAKIEGSWIGDRGLEVEPVTVISFLIDAGDATKLDIFRSHILDFADTLKASGEDAVLIEEVEIVARFV